MAVDEGFEPYVKAVSERAGLDEVWIIDDEFGRSSETDDLKAALRLREREAIEGFCSSLEIDVPDLSEPKEQIASDVVSACLESGHRAPLESFLGLGEGGAEAFEKFWEHCGQPCPVERIRPQEAKEKLDSKEGDGRGRLIVADLNLEYSGMRKNAGASILQKGLDTTDRRWGVLISHEFNGGRKIRETEFEQVIEETPLDRRSVVPVAKESLLNTKGAPPIRVVVLLLSALMSKPRDELLEDLRQRLKKETEPTTSALEDLSPHEFAQAVVWSSDTDGTPPAETLARILQSNYRTQIHRVVSRDTIRESLQMLSTWKPPVDEALPYPEFPEVSRLHQSEKLDSQAWLTELNSRPRLGDIFILGEEDNPLLLLEQPCDLALRPGGERNISIAKLVPLTPRRRKGGSLGAERFFAVEGLQDWDYLNLSDGQVAALDFGARKLIEVAVLDLTALREDGRATLDLDETIELSDKPLEERLQSIQRRLRDSDALPDDFDSSNASLVSDLPIITPACEESEDTLIFDISRIARLRDKWASAALSAWAVYKTRDAFPVPVDRGLG